MPGKRITIKQVKIYMDNRQQGSSQVVAAAKAGISQRIGRSIDHNKRSSERKMRAYRTRKDPFVNVWDVLILPLLEKGEFQAKFLLEQLQKQFPGDFQDSVLRSLQRRIKQWKALYGKDKEVMFRQTYRAGELGASDFTHLEDEISIRGKPFEHILYHFRLPFSGFNYVQPFRGSGESFSAFSQGLQGALQILGGAPLQHRTDSLSAAFKNLSKGAHADLTERYSALSLHYGMKTIRNNRGIAHENGTIEASHRHIKERIRQSLLLRGTNDFSSFEEYKAFIFQVVKEHMQGRTERIAIEKKALQPLPPTRAIDYEEAVAIVSSTSTIQVKRVTYTVHSRLIGERLLVKIFTDKIECYLGTTHTATLERITSPVRGKSARKVDYHHIIGSLIKKPGAFRGAKIRDDLIPNEQYRFIWEYVDRIMDRTEADKFIVGLLHLAATHNCQDELGLHVLNLIQRENKLSLVELENKFKKHTFVMHPSTVTQHALVDYNALIPGELV